LLTLNNFSIISILKSLSEVSTDKTIINTINNI
jgi:hypothetical protein